MKNCAYSYYFKRLGFSLHVQRHKADFNAGPFQQVGAVCQAVLPGIDDLLDTGLDDQFGAFDAGRIRDVHGRSFAVVVGAGNFGDRIGFGMENVGLGEIILIFAHVFESGRGAVVTVRNDHFVLDDQGAYLSSLAVTVFCPYIGHPQIAEVQFFLFVFLAFHCRQFCGVFW